MKTLIVLAGLLASSACNDGTPAATCQPAAPPPTNSVKVVLPDIPDVAAPHECVEFDYKPAAWPDCTYRLLWCGGYHGGLTKLWSRGLCRNP